MPQIRAATPADAFWTLDPFVEVRPGDPWHTDLDAALSSSRYGVVTWLTQRLTPTHVRPEFCHLGIVGTKGTGKTTQVRKAMADLAPHGVHAVVVNALAAFDQADLSFSDLILVLAQKVVEALDEAGVEVPREHFELLKLWFAEELLSEDHRRQILASVEAEAQTSVGVRFLAKLSAKVTGTLKSDNEYRREIRRRAERDPAVLVDRANSLLDAAARSLSEAAGAGREIAIVVDNLEKLSNRHLVDAAVLRRADALRQLRCHLVLFFDTAAAFAPAPVRAGAAGRTKTVPMLPVRERVDPPDHVALEVVNALRELLGPPGRPGCRLRAARRVSSVGALFSGGRLRDVFHVVQRACDLAGPGKIRRADLDAAARGLTAELSTLVKLGQWSRLAEIHRDKQVANDPGDGYLILHSLVLNYDTELWWDVHPRVRLGPRFDVAWRTLSRSVP
jgi:hypothetical protein